MARAGSRKTKLNAMTVDIATLPPYYQSYVFSMKQFLTVLESYRQLVANLGISKPLLEWMDSCRECVNEFEQLIQNQMDELVSHADFVDQRPDMASALEYTLDETPNSVLSYPSELSDDECKQMEEVDELMERIYLKVRDSGYEMYHYWINAEFKM